MENDSIRAAAKAWALALGTDDSVPALTIGDDIKVTVEGLTSRIGAYVQIKDGDLSLDRNECRRLASILNGIADAHDSIATRKVA